MTHAFVLKEGEREREREKRERERERAKQNTSWNRQDEHMSMLKDMYKTPCSRGPRRTCSLIQKSSEVNGPMTNGVERRMGQQVMSGYCCLWVLIGSLKSS